MKLEKEISVLLPQVEKIITDTASYWAAFYCSVLKTIRYQINLQHRWGESRSLQEYRGELRESRFFNNMKSTVLNHAFEYVMVDFLKTTAGRTYFEKLCEKVLGDYEIFNFKISLMNIFKVGTDSEIFNARQNYRKTRMMMLLPNGIKAMPESSIALPSTMLGNYQLNDTLRHSDLFVIISNGEETIGFVGEVEGNHGEELYRRSYFERNKRKDQHCVFGISVSDKRNHADVSLKEKITLNRSSTVERWILNFSKSNFYIKDYHASIENLQNLIEGHFGYMANIEDQGHTKILEIIKTYWKKDIADLINSLEAFVDFVSPIGNFHYQETIDGKMIYRPSPLVLPDQLPLYSIDDISVDITS